MCHSRKVEAKLKPNFYFLNHYFQTFFVKNFELPCLLAQCSWLLSPGSLFLAPGFWLLAPGPLLLAPSSWLLVPGSWLLACCSWLLASGFWLLAFGFPLLAPSTALCPQSSPGSCYPGTISDHLTLSLTFNNPFHLL